MSYPAEDKPRRHMEIGLIAYGADGHDPSLVFVRVPTERGRWVLTDRCVIEVPCGFCGAVIGEPCRRGSGNGPLKHGAGTHCDRREQWQRQRPRYQRKPVPKLRIPAPDLVNAMSNPEC